MANFDGIVNAQCLRVGVEPHAEAHGVIVWCQKERHVDDGACKIGSEQFAGRLSNKTGVLCTWDRARRAKGIDGCKLAQ
jgi:hypothetical protein